MELVTEVILLAVDAAVFAFCYKMFRLRSENYRLLKKVPIFEIDNQLPSRVQERGGKIHYAAVTGVVRTTKSLFHFAKHIAEVIIGKTGSGSELYMSPLLRLWYSAGDDIMQSLNTVPFMLYAKAWYFASISVQMVDPVRAKIFTLSSYNGELISGRDFLEDTIVGFFQDHDWHNMVCDTISRMKSEVLGKLVCGGTVVTAVGELVLENGELRLQPPSIPGASYFLTSLPFDNLIRKIDIDSDIFKQLSVIMGCIGALLCIEIIVNIQKRNSHNNSHS